MFRHTEMLRMRLRASRCVNRLRDWWPDSVYASLLAVAALVLIVNRDGAERLTIGRALPGEAADIYLAGVLLVCVALLASIMRRKPVIASRSAAVLAILLAVQGVLVLGHMGTASIFAASAYLAASCLVVNRSIVLARGIVVPWWIVPRGHT